MWLMFGYQKIYKHDIIYVHDKYTYMYLYIYVYMYITCGFSTFCSSDV